MEVYAGGQGHDHSRVWSHVWKTALLLLTFTLALYAYIQVSVKVMITALLLLTFNFGVICLHSGQCQGHNRVWFLVRKSALLLLTFTLALYAYIQVIITFTLVLYAYIHVSVKVANSVGSGHTCGKQRYCF